MPTGTVKWFNSEKGYGFIAQQGGPDVFVHYKAIQGHGYRTLEESEPVEFEVEQGAKGLQAVNVVRMSVAAGE
jgi:CspA family cold shock protein